MSEYFGMFKDIKQLNEDEIKECGIYEGIFSNIYTHLTMPENIIDCYIENALAVGKDVLEIACGDGGNYMIPMAKRGFNCDGIDISQSMIERFIENRAMLPNKVKKRLNAWVGDVFSWDTEKKYDLITIPSTTICLLADDMEKTKKLIKKTYDWLKPGGRFMFDFRTDQFVGKKKMSEIYGLCSAENQYMMLMQEYENMMLGRTIVNMYIEKVDGKKNEKYIASSNKKIITDDFINELMKSTDYKLHNKYLFDKNIIKTKLIVYCKEEDCDGKKSDMVSVGNAG